MTLTLVAIPPHVHCQRAQPLAIASRKSLLSLETIDTPLAAQLPQNTAELLPNLQRAVERLESGRARRELARHAATWADGDLASIANYAAWCERLQSEAARADLKRINDPRNPALADAIAARLSASQRVFAAVGALHMTLPASLPLRMAQRGYSMQRIELQNAQRGVGRSYHDATPPYPGAPMTDPTAAFAKMVPGFDFLQGLVKNAGAAMPGVGQWVAPTLDPEELDKRIKDLRTVQFWLEQNAKLLGVTIQALEVQRMTLSTLKTMNVSMSDLTASLQIPVPAAAATPPPPAPAPAAATPPPPATAPAAAAPAGAVDPLQWWGALTQQFSQLAANSIKDAGADGGNKLAGSLVQQGLDAAKAGFKQATAQAAVAKTRGTAARRAAATPAATQRAPTAKRAAAASKRGSAKPR